VLGALNANNDALLVPLDAAYTERLREIGVRALNK